MTTPSKQHWMIDVLKYSGPPRPNLSQGRQPSLIVLDLDMPRMGGREVLARLKSSAATSGIPVVVFTGSEEDKTEAELMDEGADDYIRKPLEPARFTARVKAVLRRASA